MKAEPVCPLPGALPAPGPDAAPAPEQGRSGRTAPWKLLAYGGSGVVLLALAVGLGFRSAQAGAGRAATVVSAGPGPLQVAGTGTLRPVEVRLVTASTEGRVDRIRLYPGAAVTTDTVLLDLSNGELKEGVQSALCQYQAAEGDLATNKARIQETILDKRSTLAILKAATNNARLELDSLEVLAKQGLAPKLSLMQSRERSEDLSTRFKIEQERLKLLETGSNGQLAIFQAKVDGAKGLWLLKQEQVAALTVRAGMNGVLESLSVQVGERVLSGSTLARVVEPGMLKAEVKISETQARDIHVGQPVTIDTRNGIVQGKVVRMDPEAVDGTVTVDASLEGPLPRGARPGQSVTALITLDRPADEAPAAAPVRRR